MQMQHMQSILRTCAHTFTPRWGNGMTQEVQQNKMYTASNFCARFHLSVGKRLAVVTSATSGYIIRELLNNCIAKRTNLSVALRER
ncbi:hypothetical protein POVWA2_037800 [Plasmodium ovale wallikeri]|uniref:Uncharacterized protein n=1 Tax=Plasmodium ovale wallikeri TaxID=864142 RepID=A0A1A8Z4P9_PLAOA|nr:hypothetical protein POVWA1_038830 [Plasmodium ovale wallikeri]SBT39396.1 hypothetical protein POVWA2_037800 [Plasmodium ovale wallikeri]